MKLSSSLIVNTLLYFNLKKFLQTISINKNIQAKTNINLNNYHLFHFIQSNLCNHSNMSAYYDLCKLKFPDMNSESIKEYLLYQLKEFSVSNDIEIDITHPFSAKILYSIDRNIILNVYELSDDNNTVDKRNIKEVKIHLDKIEQKNIGTILETMVPKSIESLAIKKEFNNYFDFDDSESEEPISLEDIIELIIKQQFQSLKKIDFFNFTIKKENSSLIHKAFPELSSITINQWTFIENCSIFSKISNLIKKLTLSYLSLEESRTALVFPQLEELSIYNVKQIEVSTFSCPMLRKFQVLSCEKCEKFIFDILKQNENTIEDFEIRVSDDNVNKKISVLLSMLKKMKNLTKLTLFCFNQRVKINELSLNNLTSLSLFVESNYDIAKIIKNNPKLISLSIVNYQCVKNPNAFDSTVPTKLEHLVIDNNLQFPSELISFILSCKRLKTLELINLNCKDIKTIMKNIGNFHFLQKFRVYNEQEEVALTKKDISNIKQCPLLESFQLDCDFNNKKKLQSYLIQQIQYLPFLHTIGIGFFRPKGWDSKEEVASLFKNIRIKVIYYTQRMSKCGMHRGPVPGWNRNTIQVNKNGQYSILE